MPNNIESGDKPKCRMKKKEMQLETYIFSKLDHHISGIPQNSRLIRKSPVDLESETFQAGLSLENSLSRFQVVSAPIPEHWVQRSLYQTPSSSEEASGSGLFGLYPSCDDPAEFQGSLGQEAISGPRLCVHVWSSRSTL